MESLKPAINEWSCALACIISVANELGITITQEEALKQCVHYFPEWDKTDGALTRMGVLRLLEKIGFPIKFVLLTEELSEFLGAFSKKSKEGKALAAFIFLHHPTHHCLRILGLSALDAQIYDPHPIAPNTRLVTWESLKDSQIEFLLLTFRGAEDPQNRLAS